MNAHLPKQQLLEKLEQLETNNCNQGELIRELIKQNVELRRQKSDNLRLINRLLALVEKWEPEECPDCHEETLVTNMLTDGQTTGSERVCYNCGYERDES